MLRRLRVLLSRGSFLAPDDMPRDRLELIEQRLEELVG